MLVSNRSYLSTHFLFFFIELQKETLIAKTTKTFIFVRPVNQNKSH